MKHFFMVLAVVLLLGLSVACGGAVSKLPEPVQTSTTAERGDGLTVVDALGRSTIFPEPPRRIIVAGRSTLTIVDALYMFPEAQERVVALVVGRQPVDAFLRLVDPAFDDKVLLEVEAGPEQIAPLEPDVVVLRSFMAERLGRSLETLDIPVVYVDLETPDRYFQDLELVGQLLGNEARAAEIRSFYRVRLDRVDESLQGLAEDQKPRVLLMQYSAQGSEIAFLVPSAEWIQTIETRLAGGIPAWSEAAQAGGWTVVSLEQVAAWDPDQVFVIAYQSASDEVVRKLKSDPQWQGLRAVREASIYGFPADIVSWDQPDPRWILGLTWLAGKMHPAHFPDLDMSWEMAQFFEQLYRMESTVVEQRILPVLKGDLE